MAVTFSPAWEYWVPDPEFSPDADDGVDQADRIPRATDARTGRTVLDGFRVGRGDPNRPPVFRFAPPKCERPDRLPSRRCPSCPRLFTPNRPGQRYCTRSCSPGSRVLPDRPCANPACGRTFRPRCVRQRSCCAACAARVGGLARAGRTLGPSPLRGRPCPNAGMRPVLDWQRFAALHAGGLSARQIARREGVNKSTVTHALRTLGVYTAGRPGRTRVLPDRPCGHCRDPFRPHHERQRFCSRPCELAGRGRKQIDPARVLALARAGRNNCQIARELGCSVTGVRRVVNANLSPAPGESQSGA